jgi:septum formation protein
LKTLPLILASTSKYRANLLSQLGWEFMTEAPGVDEEVFKGKGIPPSELALKLSELKAKAVFDRHPNSWVIGSDQVCTLEGKILSKPHTKERAVEQLQALSGKIHELLTAVTIASPRGVESFLNTTSLTMRPLKKEEIQRYVDKDLPLDCAGSYKLESFGIKLFSKIEMDDHTAIIGLPLIELCNRLVAQGFPL